MPMVPAVILAAGFGRRIASISGGGAKALLPLHGRSLLERSLDGLADAGFERVVVVTGHGADEVRARIADRTGGTSVSTVFNEDYASGNNILSMLAAASVTADGFCLLNSDIVFEPSILTDLRRLEAGNWLVLDGDEPLGAEEMKVVLDADGRVARISKSLPPETSAGEYIGIARFDAAGAATVMASAARLVAAGGRDLYYEDAIDAVAGDLGVGILWTRRRPWTEIDDEVDYRRALDVAATIDGAAGTATGGTAAR